MRSDREGNPELYARAAGLDLESELRAEIARARAAAVERCPAARTRIDQMARALGRRVTGLTKAQRRLEKLGERKTQRRDSRPPAAAGGIGNGGTLPVRPAREYALEMKRHARAARDFEGITITALAELLGEHEDTVESWLSDSARQHVPMWVLGCPALPRKMRAHLMAVFKRAAGECAPPCAQPVEAHANAITGSVGQLLAMLSEHMRDAVIDRIEARQQLPLVRELRTILDAYEQRLLGVMEGHR